MQALNLHSPPREMVLLVAGVAMIGFVLWEVFQDLFRPAASGAISDWLGRRLFNLLRRWPRALPVAGPLVVVLMIGTWVVLLSLGFTLVFYGAFPSQFMTSTGDAPAEPSRFAAVSYFSFETLITLGYGDLVPRAMPVRFLAAIEGLVGFGLLTASVSMLVLIYPALERQRVLARSVSYIVSSEERGGTTMAASGSDVMLSGLARDVARLRIDLLHFPVIYYFTTVDKRASVAHWIGQLQRWAAEGLSPGTAASVRLAAGTLQGALADLAVVLKDRFLPHASGDAAAIFQQYAADHCLRIAQPK